MRNIYIVFLISFLTLSSCFDDLGNYDYKDLNEVKITGLEAAYRVDYPDGELMIEPKLESSFTDIAPDRYSYEWKAVGTGSNKGGGIMGTDIVLNSTSLGLFPGNYYLYFKVKDKETGLEWKEYTYLSIATTTARGFLLMGNNKEGYMQLDMLKMPAGGDTIVALDLLRNADIPPIKNAKNVVFTGGMANMTRSKFWIMGEDDSYYVDRTTFESNVSNVFRPMTFSLYNKLPDKLTVVDVAARVGKAAGSSVTSNARAVSTKEGFVFYANNLINGDVYGNPVNRIDPNEEDYFKASPYLMYSLLYWRGFLVYDEDEDRFTQCASNGTNVTKLSDRAFDPFPWNQEDNGRKLFYAENTKNTVNGARWGGVFAMMKDDNADYHLYNIDPVFASKLAYYSIKKEIATNWDVAAEKKLFAFSSHRTLIYYAAGDNLYYYDYNRGNERSGLLKSFNGEEITMLQVDIQTDNNGARDLYVATKDSEGVGTLRKLVIGTDVDVVDFEIEEDTEWTGLSAIVRMDWRNKE